MAKDVAPSVNPVNRGQIPISKKAENEGQIPISESDAAEAPVNEGATSSAPDGEARVPSAATPEIAARAEEQDVTAQNSRSVKEDARDDSDGSSWWMFGAGFGVGLLGGWALNRDQNVTYDIQSNHQSNDQGSTSDPKPDRDPKPDPYPKPEPKPVPAPGPAPTPEPPADTVAPQVSDIRVLGGSGGNNGVFSTGDTITFAVSFSEKVDVETNSQPALKIQVGDRTQNATYLGGAGSDVLLFQYTVQPGDLDANGIQINAGALAFPSHSGGALHDLAGNEFVQNDATYAFSDYRIDTTVTDSPVAWPQITSIQYSHADFYAQDKSNPFYDPNFVNHDNILHAKDTFYVKVNFNEAVYVSGVPQLKLSIGGMDRYAELSSGSGTKELFFKYTVTDTDHDLNGMSVVQDGLFKNGGSIADKQGRVVQGFDAGDFGVNDVAPLGASGFIPRISAAGQDTIDLGPAWGNLIKPLQVEGKWYYLLDANKDGKLDRSDMLTHDKLDQKFTLMQDSREASDATTSDTQRYGWFRMEDEIGLLKAALPSYGRTITEYFDQKTPGTSVNSPTQLNAKYDDFSAIWDAFNGSTTKYGGNGLPPEWAKALGQAVDAKFWTATESNAYFSADQKHMTFNFATSEYGNKYNDEYAYVIFQVI